MERFTKTRALVEENQLCCAVHICHSEASESAAMSKKAETMKNRGSTASLNLSRQKPREQEE
eukprot:745432-Amphidinium_carterae.1